jgi:hypothetical protein
VKSGAESPICRAAAFEDSSVAAMTAPARMSRFIGTSFCFFVVDHCEITTINLNARSLRSLKTQRGQAKQKKTCFLKKSSSLCLSLSFAPLR